MKWLPILTILLCLPAEGAVLCRDGQALMPIVVSPNASEAVKKNARQFAEYLGRIGGAKFEVSEGDAAGGISLQVVADRDRPERYTIQTDEGAVRIIGASDLAVQHAVWDLLYRIGYRQYFPTETWEIVPKRRRIEVDLKVDEQPDYRSRLIWYGYGTNGWNVDAYKRWIVRNRMGGAFELRTGHAWNAIVARHKEQFAKHPEWLALIDGKRIKPNGVEKFCVSNDELRRLVVRDALAQAKARPQLDSISLDPSDGLGWCECEACAAIGSPSDRVILLANQAAAALEKAGHRRMHVGVYAYGGHARAPKIKPHPKVIVSIATAFSDRSADELLAEWQKAGVNQVGIREYHSVFVWSRHFPGASRSSNTKYLVETTPRFHGYGAQFYTSESGDSWGCDGFGHFLSTRLLWDVKEADRAEEIRSRFIKDCFGDAGAAMAKYYSLLEGANKPLISKDLIGRLNRSLDEARKSTSDAGVHARLDDLALYTRFVELMYLYRQGDAQKGMEAIQFAWRIRKTSMVHSYALYRELAHRGPGIKVPDKAGADDPEESNPWKSSEPFTKAEIARLVAEGIAKNPLLNFTPRQFTGPLRPARLKRGNNKPGSFGPHDRYDQSWLIWVSKPGKVRFQALTGVIAAYRHFRDTRFELHTIGQPIDGRVDLTAAKPDGKTHDIALTTKVAGLHRLTSADAGTMTTMTFPDEAIVTREASTQSPLKLSAGARLYFFVPRGTKTIGGFSSTEKPRIFPADESWDDGRPIDPGYFAIDVPPNQDGRCWRIDIRSSVSEVILMTVPPYVARSPEQLLLPAEVVGDGR